MTLHYTYKNDLYLTRVYKKFAWWPVTVWEELKDGVEQQMMVWFEYYLQKDIYRRGQTLTDQPIVRRFIKL